MAEHGQTGREEFLRGRNSASRTQFLLPVGTVVHYACWNISNSEQKVSPVPMVHRHLNANGQNNGFHFVIACMVFAVCSAG